MALEKIEAEDRDEFRNAANAAQDDIARHGKVRYETLHQVINAMTKIKKL